ncbi:MAG: S-layer homology domain-containing protein [Oscillospiraceae bacterium]|nr:S-layer homology domain-containing protein [Oscillospiraceae bacterium]
MKKNFKRLLCLVLVVSLVCTLGVTAFAANSSLTSYTDVDNITYAEAVDLLTGAGILQGSDGEFRPNDTVTRAEAAKIISYLALGADTADALAATTAPFDDVPLTHWAVGYIAYCASAGIINGYGDGNFGPDDSVTLYELAKMLLCVEGYGVNGEYTGTAWQIQTAADAGVYGLFDGKEGAVNGTSAATREETALLAFNALVNVAQAKYNETFAEYYVGSSALNAISITVKGEYQYKTYVDAYETAYNYTIGYQKYDLTKVSKGSDAFDRDIYAWQCDGEEITDSYVTSSVDYSIDGKATPKAVKSTVGSTNSSDLASWTIVTDGVSATTAVDWTDDDNALVNRGQTMEVYVTTGNTRSVKAIIVTDYLAQVTDVSEDDGDIELTLDVYLNGSTPSLTIDSDTASNLAGYAEDDWVIVNCANDGNSWSVEAVKGAATTVEGVPTAYAGSAITVDGTKYNYSYSFSRTNGYGHSDMEDAYQDNYDDTFILYLDTYGNIIGFEPADESASSSVTKNYLYVESLQASGYDGFDDAEVKVKASFTDGTTQTIYLKVSSAGKTTANVTIDGVEYALNGLSSSPLYYSTTVTDNGDGTTTTTKAQAATSTGNTSVAGQFYAYTVNSDGYYTLKSIGSKAAQYSTITVTDKSAVTLGGATKYATSSTKLVLVDDQKTYTGYSNFADLTALTTPVLAIFTNSAQTRLSYIYVFGDDVTTADNLIYAMYKGAGDSTSDGYYYDFYVNGSVVSYLFEDSQSFDSYRAGWIEEKSDGYTTFTQYVGDDYNANDTAQAYPYAQYDSDNYLYVGVVTSVSSESIAISLTDASTTEDYVFAIADDCETTRVKSGSSRSASSANEGDLVWIFTDDDAVANTMSAEAVAIIAINPDLAPTYFSTIGVIPAATAE